MLDPRPDTRSKDGRCRARVCNSAQSWASGNGPNQVILVGTNGAGPWAAAAASISGEAVHRVAVDTAGFRFSDLTSYRSPDFLPGAVKYGDLPGILSLLAPRPLWLTGEAEIPDAVRVVYEASGSNGRVTLSSEMGEAALPELANWLSRGGRNGP